MTFAKFNHFPQFMSLKSLFHTFILNPGLRHPFSLQDLGPLQQTVKQNIKEGCFFFHFHCFEIGLLLLFLRTVKHFNDKLLLNVTLLLLSDVNTAYFFHHYIRHVKGRDQHPTKARKANPTIYFIASLCSMSFSLMHNIHWKMKNNEMEQV